jgi:hypothetical protein
VRARAVFGSLKKKKNIEILRAVLFFFWELCFLFGRCRRSFRAHELARRMVRDEHKVSDMEQRKAPKFITIGEGGRGTTSNGQASS